MIIDDTYYVGELTIAQLSDEVVADNFNSMAKKLERKYFEKMFGLSIADDFLIGIEQNPIEQKWEDLLNGVSGKWRGFKNDLKISPLANYVYFYYNFDLYSFSVGTGEVIPENENSRRYFNYSKLCKVWNDMVDMNYELSKFLNENYKTYNIYHSSSCGATTNELFEYKNSLNL